MHLRITRHKRNDKVYEYAQIVESVRRPDGMPVHRLIGNLGALSDLEIDNLRSALRASREGHRVVIAPYARTVATPAPDVVANLRYLDVAVPLEIWRQWGLHELLEELMPRGEADVAPASVVAALVVQRLVDPGSKLYATEWFPRSALPELLDLAPSSFNNTRLHRTLAALDAVGSQLMSKLPRRYVERDGAFASLFMDVSDAAFVGHGPSLAARAKTKEGNVARKIGIVLLCNEHGYPLRWDVVAGTAHDSRSMLGMMEAISDLRWVGSAPVVCDRAMGKTATIAAMSDLRVRFVTAVTTTEFSNYGGAKLACEALGQLAPNEISDEKMQAEAARLVTAAGMQKVDDTLYVTDLGLIERPRDGEVTAAAPAATATHAMKLCRRMIELVESKQSHSFEQARHIVGLGKGVAGKYRGLHKLADDLQLEVLSGRADARSLDELLALTRFGHDEQRRRFAALVAAPPARKRLRAAAVEQRTPSRSLKVHAVAYFNPQLFVEKRHRASALLADINDFVAELNARLARASSRRTRASVLAELDRKLRANDVLDAFAAQVHEDSCEGKPRLRLELRLDAEEWARRRRFDGFTILVAHPELAHSAAELCRLYRAKDIVEKDFHIIKSVVEVRPVWHHADDKVRAHVTLCMLALLLERTIRTKLGDACSAERALQLLEPCRLNQFTGSDNVTYGLTRPTAEQRALIERLQLKPLLDDQEVAERIRPR